MLLLLLQVPNSIQLIIVDANSTDNTASVAATAVALLAGRVNSFTVVTSMSGRAMALNAGAGLADGDIMLFLHADTRLPQGWDAAIVNSLSDPSVVAGAFSFCIDRSTVSAGIQLEGISVLEFFTNFRAHALWLPYGDQALFMTRARWLLHGPFEWLPMMEDYVFMRKLRKIALSERSQDDRDGSATPPRPSSAAPANPMILHLATAISYVRRAAQSFGMPKTSKIDILPAAALCGARRWEKNGILTNTLLNQAFVFAYTWLRVPAPTIFEWYYGRKWTPSSVLNHPVDPSIEQINLTEGILAIRAVSPAER
jgi:glycosyltransferase involved in cell wall biosynthesis